MQGSAAGARRHEHGLANSPLSDIAALLRALSGRYDQAARAAAVV